MRRPWWALAVLAAMRSTAGAQEVPRPVDAAIPPGAVMVVPGQPAIDPAWAGPGTDPAFAAPGTLPPGTPPAEHRGFFARWLDRKKQAVCRIPYPDAGCGDWHQDCIFIFGSCRAFYREPCLPGPTPLPPPPGYGVPGAYGSLSVLGAAPGCGCP